jgi:ABC-type phosphate/phosphonate transport system substrate-binding protein
MSKFIAALPMYDWPERRAEVDAEWAAIRDRLRASGVDAPEALTRDFDEPHELWRRPNLLFAQTCWGPMEQGLAEHVQVVGQPGYDGIEGGQGESYSSAIVMRRGGGAISASAASLPLDLMRGKRFAYNSLDSMSGLIGLTRDLEAIGESLDIFSYRIETGGHRLSVKAIAEGRADIAAIDCRSWQLAQRYEPAAAQLQVVGWTVKRPGLPFITAKSTPPEIVAELKAAMANAVS